MFKKQPLFFFLLILFNTNAICNENSEFWNWFESNKSQYFKLNFDDTNERDRLFHELGEKLKGLDENLTFEFGLLGDNKRDFVISAGGIESSFPNVIALVNAAPDFLKWKITAFRQKKNEISSIKMGNTEIDGENTFIQLFKDGNKIGVVLYLPEYKKTPNQIFEQIGFLLLDQTLGEYVVGTKVGFVEFEPYKKGIKNIMQLKEIPNYSK